MARRRALFSSPDSRKWRTESAPLLRRDGIPSAVETVRFIYRIVTDSAGDISSENLGAPAPWPEPASTATSPNDELVVRVSYVERTRA